ncbi:hypothetical protein Val02_79100 [Virgisporangium aliadipatigenens]|uniref:CBM2 domain-containing protein n=1 Tax=Virgisporangium aliadipatigenens TaxID=741659 RepID=A0A8J4DUP5_9ACTN|nr:SRPBCC domain-containing protein [Virgisporangium aliadipatigenens]GIJ51024.1 hypothetical protein Val02_79100 [Virgisporangium aliadipatigenens]
MTEIRLDVDVAHPPERVWRALTDAAVLAGWFAPAKLRPVVGHTFRVEAKGQPGFEEPIDAEVLEVDAPRRLAMRWRAPELDARVSVSIARVGGGSRVTLRQSGFFGMQGLLRRRVLHRTYTEMLGRRLPEALDRLAVEDGKRGPVGAALARRLAQRTKGADHSGSRRNARPYQRRGGFARRLRAVGRVTVTRPLHLERTVPFARRSPAHGRRGHRRDGRLHALGGALTRMAQRIRPDARGRHVAVGAGLLLVIALVSLIVVAATLSYPPGSPLIGPGNGQGHDGYAELPGGTRPPASAGASRGGSASGQPAEPSGVLPTASGGAHLGPNLTAVYRTETVRLGGYRGAVTISNPGGQPVEGWTVVLTLPVLNLTIRKTAGAQMKQDGDRFVFTPSPDTRLVGPGRTALFTYEADGVGKPTACTVNGQACGGI